MLRKGFAKDPRQVFKEFLGSRGKAYLPKTVLEPDESVRLLASMGATVCLAHPLLWKAPAGWLDSMVARLKEYGSAPLRPTTASIPRPMYAPAWPWPSVLTLAFPADRTITDQTSPLSVWDRATGACASVRLCLKA